VYQEKRIGHLIYFTFVEYKRLNRIVKFILGIFGSILGSMALHRYLVQFDELMAGISSLLLFLFLLIYSVGELFRYRMVIIDDASREIDICESKMKFYPRATVNIHELNKIVCSWKILRSEDEETMTHWSIFFITKSAIAYCFVEDKTDEGGIRNLADRLSQILRIPVEVIQASEDAKFFYRREI